MTRPSVNNSIALLSTALTLQLEADVQLLPAGVFEGRDGRPGNGLRWNLTDAQGRALAERLSARHASVRFSFDYEHQALLTESNGQPAPASGWASRFEWRAGHGLFALSVQWTEKARRMIAAGEYRYLSPVLVFDKKTGEVRDLVNAALTNIPALDMRPLAQERVERLRARIAAAAGEEELSAQDLAVCRATGIDPGDFLKQRIIERAQRDDWEAGDLDLTEVELAVCRACGLDPHAFAALRQDGDQDDEFGGAGLSDDELSVCRATGIDPGDFLAMRDE